MLPLSQKCNFKLLQEKQLENKLTEFMLTTKNTFITNIFFNKIRSQLFKACKKGYSQNQTSGLVKNYTSSQCSFEKSYDVRSETLWQLNTNLSLSSELIANSTPICFWTLAKSLKWHFRMAYVGRLQQLIPHFEIIHFDQLTLQRPSMCRLHCSAPPLAEQTNKLFKKCMKC